MFMDMSCYGYSYPANRTIYNTRRTFFNCGGYALGELGWYLPWSEPEDRQMFDKLMHRGWFHKAETLMADEIQKDFPDLIEIPFDWVQDRAIDYKKFEVIAFRIAYERDADCWDFHFRKLAANGRWYDKIGQQYDLNYYDYDSIFNDRWNGRYNGKIIFFARPRK